MTKTISRESLGYAILLIVLCTIASLATWQTISYLDGKLSIADYNVVTITIWSLTLGFMLIAGAFGLWATNFAAEAESRRRVSKIIETMDYILDGIISIDEKAYITGANTAACKLANNDNINKQPLSAVFHCLSPDDIKLLTNRTNLNEIEKTLFINNKFKALRFRSQPTKGLSLILISDITLMQEQKQQRRQNAQLQLIGELSKGVAADFDNLLCGIAANAAILRKLSPDTSELQTPAKKIITSAEKGTLLARKLNDLANSSSPVISSRLPTTYIQAAVTSLRYVLSDKWEITNNIEPLQPISLTGTKLEQVILNLGIITADLLGKPGTLFINASPLPDDSPENLKKRCACVITICASTNSNIQTEENTPRNKHENSGIILSVIRSIIMEAGGSLEPSNITNQQYAFKIYLAHGQHFKELSQNSTIPDQAPDQLVNKKILLATTTDKYKQLETFLISYQARVTKASNIITLLAEIDKTGESFDILIIEDLLTENETETVLKTISVISPKMNILVLSEEHAQQPITISENIAFINENSAPDDIIMKTIEMET